MTCSGQALPRTRSVSPSVKHTGQSLLWRACYMPPTIQVLTQLLRASCREAAAGIVISMLLMRKLGSRELNTSSHCKWHTRNQTQAARLCLNPRPLHFSASCHVIHAHHSGLVRF